MITDQHGVACYHCGEPVPGTDATPAPNKPKYSLEIEGVEQPMCCPGCQAVAATILATGLGSYYNYRTATAITPTPLDESVKEELKLYDRADIQADFVDIDGQTATAALIIEGITCAACSWLIEHRLMELPAVEHCSVRLSDHRALVRWRHDETKLSDILATLYRTGYQGHPYLPDQQQAVRKKEQQGVIRRLGVAGIGMMQVMMFAIALYAGAFEEMLTHYRDFLRTISWLIATPVVFYSAQPFFKSAWRSLNAHHLNMDVPVSLAILIAYTASAWSTATGGKEIYFDSVCMFTFFLLLGRFLEAKARHNTLIANEGLQRLLPQSVIRVNDAEHQIISIRDLQLDDHVLVKPGQPLPADGVITEGIGSVDESSLTGEYLPVNKAPGDAVIAGSLNIVQPLTMRVTATGKNTRLHSITRLLDQATADKPPIAALADKVAQYFVGFVLLFSALIAWYWSQHSPEDALWITLSVLVVTCPCALSLATPTALTVATGALQRLGLLVLKGHVLQALTKITHVIFDKTGTLTYGRLSLEEVIPCSTAPRHQCYAIAAALEAGSEHPIARAFEPDQLRADHIKIHTGQGLEGRIGNKRYFLGQPEFVHQRAMINSPPHMPTDYDNGLWLLLAEESNPLCWFQLSDSLRASTPDAVDALKNLGLKVSLLSGDQSPSVSRIAASLEVPFIAGASPESKLAHVRSLQAEDIAVAMVGDGMNDIPVLAGSDVSIAMTDATDLTKAGADAILLSGELTQLPQAIELARKTQRIIKQNLSWALIYNFCALPVAAAGLIPPYVAAIGMSLSSLIVVTNALRLRIPEVKQIRQEPEPAVAV